MTSTFSTQLRVHPPIRCWLHGHTSRCYGSCVVPPSFLPPSLLLLVSPFIPFIAICPLSGTIISQGYTQPPLSVALQLDYFYHLVHRSPPPLFLPGLQSPRGGLCLNDGATFKGGLPPQNRAARGEFVLGESSAFQLPRVPASICARRDSRRYQPQSMPALSPFVLLSVSLS